MKQDKNYWGYDDMLLREYVENMVKCSDKKLEDLLGISQYDLRMTNTLLGKRMLDCEGKLGKAYERAMWVFAGLCVTPLTALVCGLNLTDEMGLGLTFGVLGCFGYAFLSTLKCHREMHKMEKTILEREEVVDTLTAMIKERGSNENEEEFFQK